MSGAPHDYVYNRGPTSGSGDLNVDGNLGNDLVYVPRDVDDPNEILFADAGAIAAAQQATALDQFINSVDCLAESRGRILERNSCREPWRNIIDLSIRQSLPGFQGHRLALQLDIFNFTNLLNEKWGEVARTPGGFSNVNLLTHVGQTPGPFEDSQGIFQFALNQERYNTQNLASNYQLQLSVRYSY